MKAKEAANASTYQEHYQIPKSKPKARTIRPKTAPATQKKVQNPQIQKFAPSDSTQNFQNLRMVVFAKCVHINVPAESFRNQTLKNDSNKSKKWKLKSIKPEKSEKNAVEEYWKTEKEKVGKQDKSKGTGKLFEPPWGYKGHQPRPKTSSDPICCSFFPSC